MASLTSVVARKPHALAVPLPAQGHMNSMMRLCNKLASEGFITTFVNIEPVHHLIEELQQAPADHPADETSAGVCLLQEAADHPKVQPGFIRRAHVPIDSLDLNNGFRFSFEHFFGSMQTLAPYLEQLLLRLQYSTDSTASSPGQDQLPPITCIISDFLLTGPCHKLARKFNLPWLVFYPFSASSFIHLDYIFRGDISQRDVMDAMNKGGCAEFCGSLPGLPPMNVEDLLIFKHVVQNENEYMYEFARRDMEESKRWGHAFVVNSFKEAEGEALRALEGRMKVPVYAVGPLVEALEEGFCASASATSLWKEDGGCMQWLNLQPLRSVLYISFGSITLIPRLQFEELVAGLLSSGHRFLFVFRPDLIVEEDSPDHCSSDQSRSPSAEELLWRSHGQVGYVAQWTPQLRVLSHPSLGAFLTHCGLNSVLEALATGVPMLCWPYFVDQFMNAKFVVHLWKVGLPLRSHIDAPIVTRHVVEQTVRAAMEAGERRNTLRQNALRFKDAVSRSLSPGGPSCKNLHDLIQSLPAATLEIHSPMVHGTNREAGVVEL